MSARFRSVSYLHTRGPGLAGHLSALQHGIMADLATVRHLLEHCVPPHYRLTGAYLRASHRCLHAHLAQVSNVRGIHPAEPEQGHMFCSYNVITKWGMQLSYLFIFKFVMNFVYTCKWYLWPRLVAGTWRVVKSSLCSTGCFTSTTGEIRICTDFVSVVNYFSCNCFCNVNTVIYNSIMYILGDITNLNKCTFPSFH